MAVPRDTAARARQATVLIVKNEHKDFDVSINESEIAASRRLLVAALIRSPKNGMELYSICEEIISGAIGARLDHTQAQFDPVVGIESELSSDRGAAILATDALFQAYTRSLKKVQLLIIESLMQTDDQTDAPSGSKLP